LACQQKQSVVVDRCPFDPGYRLSLLPLSFEPIQNYPQLAARSDDGYEYLGKEPGPGERGFLPSRYFSSGWFPRCCLRKLSLRRSVRTMSQAGLLFQTLTRTPCSFGRLAEIGNSHGSQWK
jgi:hypothetical protein